MTRIIGGSAGGRRIRTPPGDRTRPTSDRVREALFSSVESAFGSLVGLGFLDLYAGSGAVGIEAASRGAAPVVLVEAHIPTARLIEANARQLGLVVQVVPEPVSSALRRLPVGPGEIDIAFVDPPYGMDAQLDADLALLADGGVLAAEAMVIVERSARSVEPSWPAGWTLERTKKYGETKLWFLIAAAQN